ncbi:hypothetical protein BN14_09842 [Rhizoctonia solani AG-1 IB]|uniref:Uncharacterized protein n=1 Tax=Thanatephorus cucumeris (strain AG1-IB / isolate 7/3/14) TaxID=1108050 RepID=M5C6Z1_THACB|nr:hypothetical protein BN14_09842 [Rhizoctonia solani AG-1 IB]
MEGTGKGREVYIRRNRAGGQAATGNKCDDSDSEEENNRHKGNTYDPASLSSRTPSKSSSHSKSNTSSKSNIPSKSSTSREREARRADRIIAEEEARAARSLENKNPAKDKHAEKSNGLRPKKKETSVKKVVKKITVPQSESDTNGEEEEGVTLDPELEAIRNSALKTSKNTGTGSRPRAETQNKKHTETTFKSTRVYNKRKKNNEDDEDDEDEELVTGAYKRSRLWSAPGSVTNRDKDSDREHDETEVEPDPTPMRRQRRPPMRPARPLTPVPEEVYPETAESSSQVERDPPTGTSGYRSASNSQPTHTTVGLVYRTAQAITAGDLAEDMKFLHTEIDDSLKTKFDVRYRAVMTAGDAIYHNVLTGILSHHFSAQHICKNNLIRPGGSITITIGNVHHRPYHGWGLVRGLPGVVESSARGLPVDLEPIRAAGVTKTKVFSVFSPKARESLFKAQEEKLQVGHVRTRKEIAEAHIFAMKCTYLTY